MKHAFTRTAAALSAVLTLGFTVACSSEPEGGQVVSCGAYAQDPDVEALIDESVAVIVGDLNEAGESSAETHVKDVFKGSINPGDTITFSWDNACGSPTDFLTAPPEDKEEFVYFLGMQGEQYTLVDGAYGMFNASDALLGEVSTATRK